MTSYTPGELVTLALDEIVPYWRNPRRISDEAVNAVAESIHRYGYTQPIVVDSDRVIILGHTRYAALRRLGVTEIPVKVARDLSAEQVKQYRLIDNRVGELTAWDFDSLAAELGELDAERIRAFFPEIGGLDQVSTDGLLDKPWENAEPEVVSTVGLVCPSCFHSFDIEVTRDAVLSGRLEAK